MSNYPDGMRSSYTTTVDMHCLDCGEYWTAEATHDFGTTELCDESDAQCPGCESWNTD